MPILHYSGTYYFIKSLPVVDISEDENNITVQAEFPGCKPDDIDISVNLNILTLRGEKKQTEKTEDKGYHHI